VDPPDPPTGADDPTPDRALDAAEPRGLTPGATAFLGLGLSIGLCLAIFVGGGALLDGWLHWSPYGLLAGLTLGVVMAVSMVVATVRKYL
jgi:F0F1-type ATP synthase assembly protein I